MSTTHPLDLLVGQWNTTGRSVAGEPTIAIKGTDKYEWLPGRKFLVHHVDVWMGEEKVNVLELIATEGLAMHSFANDGTHEVMRAVQNGERAWSFEGENARAHLTITDAQSMSARWERKEADSWTPWLEMQFAKVT